MSHTGYITMATISQSVMEISAIQVTMNNLQCCGWHAAHPDYNYSTKLVFTFTEVGVIYCIIGCNNVLGAPIACAHR